MNNYIDEKKWAQETADKICKKLRVTAERNRHKIPYMTYNGVFDDMSGDKINWWTNGFWGGLMWQMYHATGDELYKEIAQEVEEKLDRVLLSAEGMDHDSGFKWLPTSVVNYRLTGDRKSRNRAILAATDLAGRFNPAGHFIRAWNDEGDGSKAGWAIIDCMMNLPLLYWAYEELKDPRFLQIATMHADMAEKYFIRQDGSVNHIVEFNPVTGEYVQSHGGQGYGQGSSWTRGQAWAIYGFVISYMHTGDEKYLNASKRVANYFIANTPESGLIPIDFRQPADVTLEDSTAAAVAACGMIELALRTEAADGALYHKYALKLLMTLDEKRCNWDENIDHIVEKCSSCYYASAHEFSMLYCDYYFIEAIWKLTDKELFIW